MGASLECGALTPLWYQSADKSAHSKEVPKTVGANFICGLMPDCRPGCAGADWTSIMLGVGASECMIYTRFDVALRLTTHCCQLRYHEITGTFEHPLFAKREGFDTAQIS